MDKRQWVSRGLKIAALGLGGGMTLAWGAQVPPGVTLHGTQHLTLHIGADPDSLDPHRAETLSEAMVIEDTFGGLVAMAGSGKVVGDLAERWTNPNPKTWVFFLRPHLKWSNGKPLLADEIVASYQRYFDPKEGFLTVGAFTPFIENAGAIVEGKKAVTTLGVRATHSGKAITITTPNPVPYLPAVLINAQFRIVPVAEVKKWEREWTKPEHIVTSGPFVPTMRLVNSKIEVKKNPHYWDASQVVLNSLTYVSSSSTTTMLQHYRNGQIDWLHEVPEGQLSHLESTLPQDVRRSPYLSNQYYALQHNDPILGKREVREALSLTIDRETLVKTIDAAMASYSFIPKGIAGVSHVMYPWAPGGESPLTMDTRWERARELLKNVQVPKDYVLEVAYNTHERHRKVAIYVANVWKKLGFKVSLTNSDYKTLLANRARGQFKVARSVWIADYDWYTTYATLFLCSEKSSLTNYCNLNYDKTLLQAIQETSPPIAKALGEKALKMAMADYAMIPLYQDEQVRLVKPYVGGYTDTVLNRHPAKDLYIIKH